MAFALCTKDDSVYGASRWAVKGYKLEDKWVLYHAFWENCEGE